MTIELGYVRVAPDLTKVDTSFQAFLFNATGLAGILEGDESSYLRSKSKHQPTNRPLINVYTGSLYRIQGTKDELRHLLARKGDQPFLGHPLDLSYKSDHSNRGKTPDRRLDGFEITYDHPRGLAVPFSLFVLYAELAEKFSKTLSRGIASFGLALGGASLLTHGLVEAAEALDDRNSRRYMIEFFMWPAREGDCTHKGAHVYKLANEGVQITLQQAYQKLPL